jgi:hypothetical protein
MFSSRDSGKSVEPPRRQDAKGKCRLDQHKDHKDRRVRKNTNFSFLFVLFVGFGIFVLNASLGVLASWRFTAYFDAYKTMRVMRAVAVSGV